MRLAYADPPYLGKGHRYDDTPEAALREYDDVAAWERLAGRLGGFEGWALSMNATNLHELLPLFPDSRIAVWVKPFAAFKRNVRIAYTWEPVLFKPGRDSSAAGAPVGRDHLSEPITMRKGFVGAKPDAFCSWVLDLIGWLPGDELVDMFPGTGGMSRIVRARSGVAEQGQLALFPEPPISGTDRP